MSTPIRRLAACLLGLVLFSASAAAAQTGAVQGRVTDAETGEPLAGVAVELLAPGGATSGSALTDPAGRFRFGDVRAGSYTLVLQMVGYEAYRSEVEVAAGGTATVTASLRSDAFRLNPVVVTASRRQEKALEAPATVAVVNREAIVERPTVTPVDHLRSVPGVDIITQGVQAANVVARGFNNIFSTTLHTLTDYRIASIPSLRVNLMHFIPANNEDIERMEVVLGPGAALYGPNTASGVLHILTRSPLDHQGTTVAVAGGLRAKQSASDVVNHDQGIGDRTVSQVNFRTAHLVSENFGFKLSGQYLRGNEWEHVDPVEFAARSKALPFNPNTRIGLRDFDIERYGAEARADWRVTPDFTAVLSAGHSMAASGIELTGIGAGQTKDWSYNYVQARANYKRFFAQAYLNTSDAGETYLLRDGAPIVDDSKLFVAQLQHGLGIGDRQNFTYGVDLLRTLPDTRGTIHGKNEDDDDITEIGAYVQSETRLGPKFDLVLAGRIDDHSRLDNTVFSPRAALVFKPVENQNFRATYNRAFSTPVSFNLFLDLNAGPAPGPLGEVLGYTIRAQGTEPGGFVFQNADGSLVGMRSPFAGAIGRQAGDLLDADAQTLWQLGIGALQALGRIDAQTAGMLRQLTPAAAGIPINVLNLTTRVKTPLASTTVPSVPRVRESTISTYEVGYKGILGKKVLLSADAWYEERQNFTSPLTPMTPLVYLDSAGIHALVYGGLRQAGFPDAQAQAQAVALARGISGLPLAVVSSPEVSGEGADILASYRNFGEVSLWGADLSATALLTDRWTLTLSGSLVSDDHFQSEGFLIALNAPTKKGSVALGYRDEEAGFNGELRGRFTSEFPVNSAPFSATSCIQDDVTGLDLPGVNDPCVEAAALLDLTLGYRLKVLPRTSVRLTVQNVLNSDYRSFVGVPEMGRFSMLQLKYEF